MIRKTPNNQPLLIISKQSEVLSDIYMLLPKLSMTDKIVTLQALQN